jgi:hypothetical protein
MATPHGDTTWTANPKRLRRERIKATSAIITGLRHAYTAGRKGEGDVEVVRRTFGLRTGG